MKSTGRKWTMLLCALALLVASGSSLAAPASTVTVPADEPLSGQLLEQIPALQPKGDANAFKSSTQRGQAQYLTLGEWSYKVSYTSTAAGWRLMEYHITPARNQSTQAQPSWLVVQADGQLRLNLFPPPGGGGNIPGPGDIPQPSYTPDDEGEPHSSGSRICGIPHFPGWGAETTWKWVPGESVPDDDGNGSHWVPGHWKPIDIHIAATERLDFCPFTP